MKDFDSIINESKPTLVDFFATWCGPCKMMHPVLEQLKDAVGENANILKIDVDKNESLAQSYGIRSVPTIMIFKNGLLKHRMVGVQSLDGLKSVLEGLYD